MKVAFVTLILLLTSLGCREQTYKSIDATNAERAGSERGEVGEEVGRTEGGEFIAPVTPEEIIKFCVADRSPDIKYKAVEGSAKTKSFAFKNSFSLIVEGDQNTVDGSFEQGAEIQSACVYTTGNDNAVEINITSNIETLFLIAEGNGTQLTVNLQSPSRIGEIKATIAPTSDYRLNGAVPPPQ